MITAGKIKWIIENMKPEGFSYDDLGINTLNSCFGWGLIDGYGNDIEGFNLWKNIYYPLFLQRVIEGVNKKYFKDIFYSIEISPYSVTVIDDTQEDLLLNYEGDKYTIDEAKEKAILYIVDKIRGEE